MNGSDTIIADDDLCTESANRSFCNWPENMRRGRNLTGKEVRWRVPWWVLERNPGMRLKDLAKQLNRKPALLTRIMSVSRCIPAAREALKDGKIGISDCYAISKVAENEDEQARLLGNETSTVRAAMISNAIGESGTAGTKSKINRVPQAKCELPGGTSVVVTAPSLSMAVICETLADALKAARKGYDDGQSPTTWAAVMRDKLRSAQHKSANL